MSERSQLAVEEVMKGTDPVAVADALIAEKRTKNLKRDGRLYDPKSDNDFGIDGSYSGMGMKQNAVADKTDTHVSESDEEESSLVEEEDEFDDEEDEEDPEDEEEYDDEEEDEEDPEDEEDDEEDEED